eukprot:Awhi_evm1s10925
MFDNPQAHFLAKMKDWSLGATVYTEDPTRHLFYYQLITATPYSTIALFDLKSENVLKLTPQAGYKNSDSLHRLVINQ